MSKQPLYQQIVQDLKNQIISHQLLPNDQVPTELELSKHYGVSRITSKRALKELENENLIFRIQGKGSFVNENHSVEKKATSKNLLFVLPFTNNPDLGNYAQGMLKYLDGKSYHLQIKPDTFLNHITIDSIMQQYAGIILYPTSSSSNIELLYKLYLNRFPTIILDKQLDGVPFSTITADNFQGGYCATEHLISLGHKSIAFISMHEITHSSSVRERYLGYLTALHDKSITFNMNAIFPIEQEKIQFESIFHDIINKFQAQNITGIVVENDMTAIHFLNLLRRQGFKVPEDFGIIGFDNLQASSLIDPSLSTISQDFDQIGYLAAENLILQIEQNEPKYQNFSVPIKLIVRESTIVSTPHTLVK